MLIDFNAIEENEMPRFKGGEKSLFARDYADDLNRLRIGRLVPGASIGEHAHTDSSEIYYAIQGTGTIYFNGQKEILSPSTCHYCPKGNTHTLINDSDEDFVFLAVIPKQ